MDAITKDLQKPAPWTLLYVDDVMLASEDKSELESQVQTWSDRLARFGLRLNVKKTEYLTTDSSEPGSIKINGTELTRTTTFKYLGSAIASDGSLGFETNSRVNAAWLKWRSMTGVLCDKNIPERLKSKIYRTVIRPVLLFVVVMDAITKDLQKPAPWTLLYADDVMLASEDKSELESQVQTWSDRLARFGLRLNVKKTEYLTTDSSEPGSIKINGTELTRTTTFKYLGSAIASDGSLGFETNSRVNAAWLKWRSMTGVLCDKNIPERLKSKIYRTVIRPVAIYGAECWPTTKEVEARLSVMETKMLRWTAGVTRLDRISNDAIRERFGVAPIVDKMREARLRWYGHVLRADEGSVRTIGLNLDVSGKRPRGRPKQRWLDTLHEDLKTVNIHPDQAFNREKWRQHIRKADSPTCGTGAKE
nr:RNA-directed DNA polymerase (reverse transcriptase) domain containing protein [Haemonchus contortus]